jgi:hypothetical protein
MSIAGLLGQVRRLSATLEARASAWPVQPSAEARRCEFAARLYAEHPAALARLLADPTDPSRIAEYRIDRLLSRIRDIFPGEGWGVRLRRLELDLAAESEPVEVDPARLAIPTTDPRFGPDAEDGPPTAILLPRDDLGEPLLLEDGGPPPDFPAALWIAGQADGLYVAEAAADVVAIRATSGVVATRGFGEKWEEVGTIGEN